MSLYPLFSVWTQPKETVRQFIEHQKLGYTVILVILAGIAGSIAALQDSGLFLDWSLVIWVIAILIAGVISGLLNVGISSLLFTGIGRLYGGEGNLKDMAIAVGPMMIPQVFTLPILLVYILIYGETFFAAPADFSFTSLPWGANLLLSLITLGASIWSVVISAKAIGLVHGFSSWRGFGVFMTVVGIFIVIFLIILIPIIMFLP